jgi:AbrB family looped-hinge helix DNA binding protein
MQATIDEQGQMVIPAKARKEARIEIGDVVSVQPEGDGRLILVRLQKSKPAHERLRVHRGKAGHLVVSGLGRTVSRKEVFKMLEQFPP